jgi:hypothetical protein
MKKPNGRPRKLDAAAEARIVEHLRAGAVLRDAALACDVTERTLYQHRLRAPAFAAACEKARAEARLRAAALVAEHHPRFFLSRTDPEHWGARLEVTTQQKAEPVTIVISYEHPEPADFWPESLRTLCFAAKHAKEAYKRDPTPATRRAKNAAVLDWQDAFDEYCRERQNGAGLGRE